MDTRKRINVRVRKYSNFDTKAGDSSNDLANYII
jgi:hypothetical protein